nr:uncharacterized protein C1orf94 homolog isoform X2 [Pogona vitticeps]
MLTSRTSLPCSAVSPKVSFPLGPFPRHIWIHHNTPQDSLDKACHEIWKRVQGLPEELQPRSSSPVLQLSCHPVPSSEALQEDGSGTSSSSQKEPLETSICKDEISLLVEQEYLSLAQENAMELETQTSEADKIPSGGPCKHPINNNTVTVPSDGDQTSEEKDTMEKGYQALTGNRKEVKPRPACDVHSSTKSTVTGILLPAKLIYQNAKSTEGGNGAPMGSNTQIAKLLAQLPLKRVEAVKMLDSKMVMEETKLIKDLLQNNVFGPAPHKESITRAPISMTESQGLSNKKQLPVFAKICSKSEPELVADGFCQNHEFVSAKDTDTLPAGFTSSARMLFQTGGSLQSTANLPLLLYSCAQLHPTGSTWLLVSAKEPNQTIQQRTGSSGNGRRWAPVPIFPFLWLYVYYSRTSQDQSIFLFQWRWQRFLRSAGSLSFFFLTSLAI